MATEQGADIRPVQRSDDEYARRVLVGLAVRLIFAGVLVVEVKDCSSFEDAAGIIRLHLLDALKVTRSSALNMDSVSKDSYLASKNNGEIRLLSAHCSVNPKQRGHSLFLPPHETDNAESLAEFH